jgi:hypothetical protein
MSDTFKYLGNKDGKAQDFLKGKINTVANASEGVVPGGSAYSKYGNLDADGKPIEDSSSNTEDTSGTYESGWRSDKADGETAWGSDWNEGAYAQQLQGGGVQDAGYLSQFESLSKGDSDVDDDGEWRTVKSLDNSGENTRADMKKLAAEWQSKGFDVRVQDLDKSQGANYADIAVRKGTGKAKAAPDKERTPIKHSPEIKEAKERVRTYEDNVLSGKTSKEIYGQQNDNKKYELDLNQGSEGIGQPQAADEPTAIATDSFLVSKKQDIKKQYEFQPK